jgi:hypothetical protein
VTNSFTKEFEHLCDLSGEGNFLEVKKKNKNKNEHFAGPSWLMPVILANWEAEIGRLSLRPSWTDHETPISKITRAK